MDRYSDVVQNENGRAVPGASILIVGADGQPATIYSDRQGAPLANPLATDSLGRWSFCAADGVYTARVSLNGTIRATLQDIRLEDPDDGFASLARTTGAGLIGMTDGRTVQTAFGALSDTVAGITNYTLPTASNTILGGVKVGTGLAIDGNGLLSATGVTQGSVSSVNGVNPNSSGAVALSTDDLAEDSSPSNLWFTPQRVRDTALTGLSLSTGSAITATDTVLTAPGKLQVQVTANATALAGKQDTSGKGTANGYAALGASRELLLPNAAGTFTSTLSNTNTAARAYALPNKDGTVALTSDLTPGDFRLITTVQGAAGAALVSFPTVFLDNPSYRQFRIVLSMTPTTNGIGLFYSHILTGNKVAATSNAYRSGPRTNATANTSAAPFDVFGAVVGSSFVSTAVLDLFDMQNTVPSAKMMFADGSYATSGGSSFGGSARTLQYFLTAETGYVSGDRITGFQMSQGASTFGSYTISIYGAT